jgi:hypothetical protein
VSVKVAGPEDPHTSEIWRFMYFYVRFDLPAVRNHIIFQPDVSNPSGMFYPGTNVSVRFESNDICGRPVLPGQFVDGEYRVTFPAARLGSPDAVRASVEFSPSLGGDSTDLSPPVRRRLTRAAGTSTATGSPIVRCIARAKAPGGCRAPAASSGARSATSRRPPTTTAIAEPTSPCGDRVAAPGA